MRTKHRNSTRIKGSMKSLLIYINIHNLITTQNCEPIFTRRPTISKQPATLLTKESEIEIQRPKNEVMRNPAVVWIVVDQPWVWWRGGDPRCYLCLS